MDCVKTSHSNSPGKRILACCLTALQAERRDSHTQRGMAEAKSARPIQSSCHQLPLRDPDQPAALSISVDGERALSLPCFASCRTSESNLIIPLYINLGVESVSQDV